MDNIARQATRRRSGEFRLIDYGNRICVVHLLNTRVDTSRDQVGCSFELGTISTTRGRGH